MAATANLTPELRYGVQLRVMKIWAGNDPWTAVGWLMALDANDQKAGLVSIAMDALAEHDVDAALAQIDSIPGHVRGRALSAVVSTMAKQGFGPGVGHVRIA